MKKLISLLMAAVMVLSLAGCISADNSSSNKETSVESSKEESKAEASQAAETSETKETSVAEEASKTEESKPEESKAEESKAEESKAEESKAEASKAEESSKTNSSSGTVTPGTYYLVGMYENDEMMGTDMMKLMESFGMSGTLVLNEDGTGTFNLYGEESELVWDEEGITVKDSDGLVQYTVDDVFLTLSAEDETAELIFSSLSIDDLILAGKAIEGTGQYAPGENSGSVGTEGDGPVYYLVSISEGENTMGSDQMAVMEALGMASTLQLNTDGSGTLTLYGTPTGITWEGNTLNLDGQEIVFEEEDGFLVMKEDESVLRFSLKSARELESAGEGIPTVGDFSGMETESEPVTMTFAGADWIENPDAEDDSEAKDLLLVWFDVENTTDEEYTMEWDSNITLTQGDLTAEEYWYFYGEDEYIKLYDEQMRTILPGGKNRIGYFFEADPEGGMMQLTVKDSWYDEDAAELISEELDPANLPGAPAEAFVLEAVTEYPELDGIAQTGTFNTDYEITLTGTSFEEPLYEDGPRLFKATFEFVNNSKDNSSFWSAANYTAYQDLLVLSISDYENIDQEVKPGEKTTVSISWEIMNDSPIALVVTDTWSDVQIGGVYPVE